MNWKSIIPDFLLEKFYIKAGAELGNALSYGLDIYPGDGKTLRSLVKNLASWEEEYAARGYKTVSLESFMDFGGYGVSLKEFVGKRADAGKELHAAKYLRTLEEKITDETGGLGIVKA